MEPNYKPQPDDWQNINELLRRKIFPPGREMMSMLIEFKKDGFGPEHSHPHEQIGYVISGKIRLTIAGQEVIAEAGEQVIIPGNVPHAVLALEDTVLLEIFTPLRADLLATTSYTTTKVDDEQ